MHLVIIGATPEGKKGLIGFPNRLSRERAKLAGAARRFAIAWAGNRAETGSRRRRIGFLESNR